MPPRLGALGRHRFEPLSEALEGGDRFIGPLRGRPLQLKLGNNDVARCDFVWLQPWLERHLPSRLPDDAHDSASLCSYVVQVVLESRWLIADRMNSILLASHSDPPFGRAYVVRRGLRYPAVQISSSSLRLS